MILILIILLIGVVGAVIWGLAEKPDSPKSPLDHTSWSPGDNGW